MITRDLHRHRLVFECTGLALLLAWTRAPALVLVPGAVILPELRRRWMWAIRSVASWPWRRLRQGLSVPTTHMAKNCEPPP